MKKFIDWIRKTGITNLAYIAGFLLSIAFQPVMWQFIAGGCVGIFAYINWNVIKKLITKK